MPCACMLPFENAPDATVWGPILWSILHGIGERVGSIPTPLFDPDERRGLNKLMKTTAKMIPCPSCKEHYEVYLKEHPVDEPLKSLPSSELRAYVRGWYWELHNWVNESNKKPLFLLDDVRPMYKDTPIRTKLQELKVPMMKAIQIRGAQMLGYQEFQNAVSTLLSLYGVSK